MVVLENEFLKVSVRPMGAELTSIFSKQDGVEHIWQADPGIWNWYGPNLFPVVGECSDQEITVDGVSYPMQRHGFCRASEFSILESSETHAKLSLSYSDATLAVYPYKFEFQVLYDLTESQVRVSYKVINKDSVPVYFSAGGHPAFNVPFSPAERYEDYYLEFELEEPLNKHLLSPAGRFTGETSPVPMNGKKLTLTRDLFNDDALVFKDIASRKVTIGSSLHDRSVEISFPQFNYLGIWAKPAAPFVCIEPWLGCGDTEGRTTEFSQKEGIRCVAHGHVFEADFTILIR